MGKQVLVVLFVTVLVSGAFSCCTPSQWEGTQGIANGYIKDGKPHLLEALVNVSLDSMSKKLHISGSIIMDGKPMNQLVLQDFSTTPGKQYTVMDGKCVKSETIGSFPQMCTSPAAKMILSSYVGVGTNKLMVNAYTDMIDGKMVGITLTKDSCIPVSATESTGGSVTFIDYFGITPGIKNMSVFDVPKICMNAETASQMHHQNYVRSSAFLPLLR